MRNKIVKIYMKFTRNGYISWAIAAMLLALLFNYLSVSVRTEGKSLYLNAVTDNLRRALDNTATQLANIKQQLAQSKGERLLTTLKYNNALPLFVYKNEQLVYWTDYRFLIGRENFTGKFAEQCIETTNGIFLINKENLPINDEERYLLAIATPIFLKFRVENEYVRSSLNPDIFPDAKVEISLLQGEGMPVKSADGRYLFSVVFPPQFDYQPIVSFRSLFLFFTVLATLLAVFQIRKNLSDFWAAGRIWESFTLLLIALSGLRLLLLFFTSEYFAGSSLFSPHAHASSILSPSLGDLSLNILFIGLITAFIYRWYYRLFNYKRFFRLTRNAKMLVAVALVLGSYFAFYFHFIILKNLYFNSQTVLDITSELRMNTLKVLSLANFIVSSVVYFFSNHVLLRLLFAACPQPKQIALTIGAGSLFFMPFCYFNDESGVWGALIFNLSYMFITSVANFFRKARPVVYFSYLYLFLSAFVSASAGAYAVYLHEKTTSTERKMNLGSQLLEGNDQLAEYELNSIIQRIRQDKLIRTRMLSPSLSSRDVIVQRIKKHYLGNYAHFDKYDINVWLFDYEGTPYNSTFSYDSLLSRFNSEKYRTEHENILFINAPGDSKRYLAYTDLIYSDEHLGKAVIDLTLKKIAPNSVYPSFFLGKSNALYDERGMSYAIYQNGRTVYNVGDFNYDRDFLSNFEKNYENSSEIMVHSARHLLIRGKSGKDVVVSSAVYPLKNILSNFSFLFLLLVSAQFILATTYTYSAQKHQMKLNFAARIQLYLNLAFFLPLLIISVLIISILNFSNREATQEAYIKSAENLSGNVATDLENYNKGLASRDNLLDLVVRIARYTQTEINLFSDKGRLLVSSQPILFENNLLSELINPKAYGSIMEQSQSKVLLGESIGLFEYNSAYVAIRSFETGEILGILGIPFFESQQKSEQQIESVLSVIMNAFTFTFIGLLILSYFASHILTEPLRMITQKIRRTTLTHTEPIGYKSDDEIGLLVGAYNKMLAQLEDSREALSRNEKESAWREMAKQVAHEIKNPLTPMKLTLQHLQRVLAEANPRMVRSIETLLAQIETLSDIATSFSSFANMPIPKNEEFELAEVLRQTVLLYKNDDNADIFIDILEGTFWVRGDQKMMGRIFTNLILNGIQAVPIGRKPEICVSLDTKEGQRVTVVIKDNGEGIAENIRNKVFLPNFSTKFTGSGIGLALAKRGIEHAGGNIWFETDDGNGTSFFIELPLIHNVEVPTKLLETAS